MKFSTRTDIEAPIEFVFQHISNFSEFELQALRRGVDVKRTDDNANTMVGMGWAASFAFRGKSRDMQAVLTEFDDPTGFLIRTNSDGIEAEFSIETIGLSRHRTRVIAGLQLSPKTISARLLVQSLKFAKSSLNKRFSARLNKIGKEVEYRYGQSNRSSV